MTPSTVRMLGVKTPENQLNRPTFGASGAPVTGMIVTLFETRCGQEWGASDVPL